jgi:hypothetical protein
VDELPATAIELLGRGRDLRIPDDDYGFSPLSEVVAYTAITPFLDGSDDGFVFEHVTRFANGDVDRDTIVALRIAGPWAILERDGARIGIAASEHAGRWYIALARIDDPPVRTTFALRSGDVWHGDGWALQPHPFVCAAGRKWQWANGSWGPHSMTVVVDGELGELGELAASLEPMPYAATIERALQLAWTADRVTIRRGDSESEAIEAFDRGVLLALARGVAGRVRWWIAIEHDWETPYAMGDDGDSLVDYLLGDQTAVAAAMAQLLAQHPIDARLAGGDAIARAIADGLGATTAVDDAGFDAWLAARPLAALPRHVRVALPIAVYTAWHERLTKAQPFVVWRVTGSG